MTQRDIVAILCIALFVFLVSFAVRSLKKRAEAQPSLILRSAEDLSGDEIGEASGYYVSTTLTDAPLDRVAHRKLLHRGKARLSVLTDGLVIDRTGEPSIAIHASELLSVGRASASIDRGVEANGLLAISWMSAANRLTTNLRLRSEDDTQELFDTISKLAEKEAIA